MILFLDDSLERTKKFRSQVPFAITVTTAQDMINELAKLEEAAEYVFLDHDLGDETYVDSNREDTGMEVVRWIEKNNPPINEIVVHTCNTPAGQVMVDRLVQAGYEVKRIPFPSLNLSVMN